jgi:hypothetical protein
MAKLMKIITYCENCTIRKDVVRKRYKIGLLKQAVLIGPSYHCVLNG